MNASEKSISIKIKNNFSELEKVNYAFEEFIIIHQLTADVSNPINLALDEILNNTITYGYQDEKDHEISIEIKLLDDKISLYIEDDSLPFNPLEVKESDTKSKLEERAVGGLGIHLIRNLLDNISYEYKKEKNCLTLEKKIKEI